MYMSKAYVLVNRFQIVHVDRAQCEVIDHQIEPAKNMNVNFNFFPDFRIFLKNSF